MSKSYQFILYAFFVLFQLRVIAAPTQKIKVDSTINQLKNSVSEKNIEERNFYAFLEKNGAWIVALTIGVTTVFVNIYLSNRNSKNSITMLRLQIAGANEVKLNQDWISTFKQLLSEFLTLSTLIFYSKEAQKTSNDLLNEIEKVIQLKYLLELSLDHEESKELLNDINNIIAVLNGQLGGFDELRHSLINNARVLLKNKTRIIKSIEL